jgi:hypothetical protein
MKSTKHLVAAITLIMVVTAGVVSSSISFSKPDSEPAAFEKLRVKKSAQSFFRQVSNTEPETQVLPALPPFIISALDYLADAQFDNGGYGSGSHYNQGVMDPHAVSIDAATTAFVGMAFIRSGSTHLAGSYAKNVNSILTYLLEIVEKSPANTLTITDVSNTQPQVKLGQNIDASMCSQFFTRILDAMHHDDPLRERTMSANQKCLVKVMGQINSNGSAGGSGWAGVLQSSMVNTALERAVYGNVLVEADLKEVTEALEKTQQYQTDNIDVETGGVRTEDAAGIELYSVSSTTRATAPVAREAEVVINEGLKNGTLSNGEVSADNFKKLGYTDEEAANYAYSWKANDKAKEQLQNDAVLAGFGNNGGEEFLSFMMTSEALVMSGGEEWLDWSKRMNDMLPQIQNNDGSWNGHHCITSPVFCTAAAIMAITADRDANFLLKNAAQ